MSKIFYPIIVFFCLCIWSCNENVEKKTAENKVTTITSLDGKALVSPTPSDDLLEKLEGKRIQLLNDSTDVLNWIWYGRFLAYAGNYQAAEEHYTRAIESFPKDERIYRHRGHRYISTRQFHKAIKDLTKASELIEGKENKVEPDGMPNAQNIPVSSTNGNIWYHLGLAQYLIQDFEGSLVSYKNCLASGKMPDNVVSATHWIYMILNRLDRPEEANSYLTNITSDMKIIENHAYYNLCLFYKNEITEEELLGVDNDASANDAVLYGLGNFHFHNGNNEKAKQIWEDVLSRDSWNSFGYIAAEQDKLLL